MIRDAEQRIRDFLLADHDLNSDIGGRIIVGELRTGVGLPAIVIQATEFSGEQSLNDPIVVSRVTILIAVWAETRPLCQTICDKLIARITSEAAVELGIWFQSPARSVQLEEHESELYSCTANIDIWL